jgi:hypothetical protein
MTQRKELPADFVAKIRPVLLELGRDKLNMMAYSMAVGWLLNEPERLNEGFSDEIGCPPLLYYFSLTTHGRGVIIDQPRLYASISSEALNYKFDNNSILIGSFCSHISRSFLEHPDICNKINPDLLNQYRDRLFAHIPELFYKESPLGAVIDADRYFATLTIKDLYYSINDRDDSPLRKLLTDYQSLRDALLRPSSDPQDYYCTLYNLTSGQHAWLKALVEQDAKEKKARVADVATAQKKLIRLEDPNSSLMAKFSRLLGSSKQQPQHQEQYQELLNPTNEVKP